MIFNARSLRGFFFACFLSVTFLAPACTRAGEVHGDISGFKLLPKGSDAFFTRIALVRSAEKTLELQYYIVDNDLTGQILLEEVLRAADRGVKVRLLMDDLSVGKVDGTLAVLAAQPNIQVRIFNPLTPTDASLAERASDWLFRLDQYGRRMHNKALIVDGRQAIIGGRNLGNEYFDTSSDFNFSDMDVLASGPITAKILDSFNTYWGDEESHTLPADQAAKETPEILAKVRDSLRAHWNEMANQHAQHLSQAYADIQKVRADKDSLIYAPAEFSADAPEKVDAPVGEGKSAPIGRLVELLKGAQYEFLAVTPYFIPRDKGVEWLTGLVKRGVKVRILTNTLASTDVPATYCGYRHYRPALLKAGIDLYEFRPIQGKRSRQNLHPRKTPHSSLHSKVYVIDRRYVVIGSFNLDPRSWRLNTELALVIDSPQLAQGVIQMFEDTTGPTASYRMALKGDDVEWQSEWEKTPIRERRDPQVSLARRVKTDLMCLLPLEKQL